MHLDAYHLPTSMAGESKTTTDRETIRRWAEERGGKPAKVKGTGEGAGDGLLRINFPGGAEEKLETISWDEFFDIIDKKKLAFLYQETTADGSESRFFKLVSRDTAQEKTG
jgi:hypothetical protein